MINYIIQVILFQLLFVLIYDLFLSKETFFTKNRYYLLFTALVSFLLPFFKINSFQKVVSKENIIMLPEIVLSPQKVIEEIPIYQSINYLNTLFVSGVVLFLVLFVLKLSKVIGLIIKYERIQKKGYTLIVLPKNSKAFSFFNFIFIGEEISEEKRKKVLAHEFVHCKQKHTLDLLFFELMKIVMWFNPMLYIYQKRITVLHEFIVDAVVSKSTEKSNYINSLISEVFQVENIAFVNQFYKKSLIKKRIIMLNKVASKKEKQLKYLVLAPLLFSMIFYVSCTSENEEVQEKQETVIYKTSLKEEDEFITEIVPFSKLDVAPVFPGCETGDKECFQKGIMNFVIENFNVEKVNELGLESGAKKIFVQFKIDKQGNLIDVKSRAPHPVLKEQADLMIKKLPKFKAGKVDGKEVVTRYTLPITFNVM